MLDVKLIINLINYLIGNLKIFIVNMSNNFTPASQQEVKMSSFL